jgi:hypothetical protein
MTKTNSIPSVKKKLKHPFNHKPHSYIWVNGKGAFRWNSTYKVYNNIADYSQLLETDLDKIDWNSCKEK